MPANIECAYCSTPRAVAHEICPNCGAYKVADPAPMAKRQAPRPMPKPIVTTDYR